MYLVLSHKWNLDRVGTFSSLHKLHLNRRWDDASAMAFIEKPAEGFAATRAVVQGPLIHVHAHKLIGQSFVHVTGIAQDMTRRLALGNQIALTSLFSTEIIIAGGTKFSVDRADYHAL